MIDILNDKQNLFKSVMLAYFILILHALLIAGLILLMVFFNVILTYTLWIFLAASAAILISGYFFYKRIKTEGKSLRSILNSPLIKGRNIEISFLKGVASVKIDGGNFPPALNSGVIDIEHRLESPANVKVSELSKLAELFKNGLISIEEYNQVKRQLLNNKK